MEISLKWVSLKNATTRARLETCYNQYAQNFCEHLYVCFQNLRYMEVDLQIFHILDPRIVKQMCFWAWWRLGMFQDSRICLPN